LQGGSFDSARGQWQTSAMNFGRAADELHREEFSRLAYAVTPRPEALRAMTGDALRDEIAAMWERLGHTVINSLAAPEIVTIKGERKFITMYANPSAPEATRSGPVWQLRDRVVAAFDRLHITQQRVTSPGE
jgi:hypothetical protein